MNPIIDIVKYREQYGDLQAAFGDDWDAYVKHYFEYGINESRENGTDFNLLAYLAAYDDVKEVFGDDYAAIAKHYVEYGMSAGRIEGAKEVIAAREAAKAAEEAEDTDIPEDSETPEDTDIPQDTEDSEDMDSTEDTESSEGTDMEDDVDQSEVCYENIVNHDDGSWTVEQYDDSDILLKKIKYNSDGSIKYYATFVFDDDLILRERVTYYNDGGIIRHEKTYNEYGLPLTDYYYLNGESGEVISPALSRDYEYDYDQHEYEYDEATRVFKIRTELSSFTYRVDEYAPNGIWVSTRYMPSGEVIDCKMGDEKEITYEGAGDDSLQILHIRFWRIW